MQRGENYLEQKKLLVLDANNQEVDPKSIDWQNATPQTFPYTLRQPPDDENALGKVKFLFPNPYSIYLHDTPARTLFNSEKHLHGCIRSRIASSWSLRQPMAGIRQIQKT